MYTLIFNCISDWNFGVQFHDENSRWRNSTIEFNNAAAEVQYDFKNSFSFKISKTIN